MSAIAATQHLLALSDDTGLLQHARFSVPRRSEGYCTDDNARALMLMARLAALRALTPEEARATASYAAFADHSWDEPRRVFRNFMGYDRRWLEDEGAADAQARAFWALSHVLVAPPLPGLAAWAETLLEQSAVHIHTAGSPRAWAFFALGLINCLEAVPDWPLATERLHRQARQLLVRYSDARREDWHWFEDVLAYDNARLPQAAMRLGRALDDEALAAAGIEALRALEAWQFDGELFHPVGVDSFGRMHSVPARFDQQPLEATAMIDACLAAADLTGEADWRDRALQAAHWFTGANDLGLALADPMTGLCRDGLHPDRVNANAGAESTLSYLLACVSLAEAGIDISGGN